MYTFMLLNGMLFKLSGCAPKIEESESGSSSEEDASAIEAKAIRKANRKLEKGM